MAILPSLSVEIAGVGVASDYARRLLADLGVRVASAAGPADRHPAIAWAESGAMALTGRPDALPRVPSGALASCAAGVGRALAALGVPAPSDPAALLGERAALLGLARAGRIAPGGATRLLRAVDGWGALALARPDDRRALPAWLELDASDPRKEADELGRRAASRRRAKAGPCTDWELAEREVARRPLAGLAERARWLGLAFAPAAPAPTSAPRWLDAAECGQRGDPRRPPRVLDFSALWAGPLCAELLASAGADVIKVESAQRLDGARAGAAPFYDLLNARKRSAVLDFRNARDADLLHALIASADIVIESARPRALAQLGIAAEAFVAARAGRVWLSITGYGRSDTPPGRVAFGDDAAVAAGAAHAVADGDGPLFCADAIADPLTGLHAALAAWAAWRSGGGALLDVALCAVTAHALAFAAAGEYEVRGSADRAVVAVAEGVAPVAAPRARQALCSRACTGRRHRGAAGRAVLIRGAEVGGRAPLDVRIAAGRIAEIGSALAREPGLPEIDAHGGSLLPGLHDHHVHLHALAAAQSSIACGPPAVANETQLAAALRSAAALQASRSEPKASEDHRTGSGWLRGVAYHESVAGELDRERLDAWVSDRPLRIQHRSGALWIVNSAGVKRLGLGPGPEARTGRLLRSDAFVRHRIGGELPDLAAVGAQLASYGVTGVTDASASNGATALAHLCDAALRGALPQQLLVMGEPDLPEPTPRVRVARGAVKAMLDDPSLPDFAELCARIRAAHDSGRNFAVHCATRAQGVFAAAAFRDAGARSGDRLEHASVAPPELVGLVASLGLTVVTQPNFIAERGDDYLRNVDREDVPWLYRARGWLAAGVPLGAGSDAPYGSPDPWCGIRAAVHRTSASGATLGRDEALSPEQALARYLAPLGDPGGPARQVAVGAPADLCLLDRPWRDASARLASADVRATWCAGRLVWQRDGEIRY